MVAIYIPVLQSSEQLHLPIPNSLQPNHKTTFMLRALHASNPAKAHKITCLGNAVTYHRRCRNPLCTTRLLAVLAEMVEAAEGPYALLGDLRFLAPKWAAGLSCYLHGAQKGVAMAVLGAVAVFRLEARLVAGPGELGLGKFVLGPGHCLEGEVLVEGKGEGVECLTVKMEEPDALFEILAKEEAAQYLARNIEEPDAMFEGLLKAAKGPEEKANESDAVSERLLETPKCPAKNIGKPDSMSVGVLNEGKIKPWKKLRGLETALLSLTEAALKLCASLVWLYLNVLLIHAGIMAVLGSK